MHRVAQRRRVIPANVVRRRQKHFNFPIAFGPIKFVLDGMGSTKGVVLAYNDNVINLPQININDAKPVRRACIQAITMAGRNASGVWMARPYKLAVEFNGVTLATVRSLYWGTKLTIDESNPDFIILDYPQYIDILG